MAHEGETGWCGFLEWKLLDHHAGRLIMAHDARAKSHQSTILAFRSGGDHRPAG